jgi:WD40 repeat protein
MAWDLTTRRELFAKKHQAGFNYCVAFSHNGARLAFSGSDPTIKLCDSKTGSTLSVLSGHTRQVTHLAFSSDGRWLASSSDDGTARLWSLAPGGAAVVLSGHTNRVRLVSFSPNRRWVATGSDDHTVRIWDIASGNLLHTFRRHPSGVCQMAFNEGSTMVFDVGSEGGQTLLKGFGIPTQITAAAAQRGIRN